MGPANDFKKEPITDGGTGVGLLKREVAKTPATAAIYQDCTHQTLQPKPHLIPPATRAAGAGIHIATSHTRKPSLEQASSVPQVWGQATAPGARGSHTSPSPGPAESPKRKDPPTLWVRRKRVKGR